MLLCADSPDLMADDPRPVDVVVLGCGNTGAVSAAG